MIMDPSNDFFKSEGYFDAGYKVYIGPGKYFVTSDVGSGRIQWCLATNCTFTSMVFSRWIY